MHRRAFTLIEILVVVAIIALLLAILLPALTRARGQGRASVCLNNMRQFGAAVHMYATVHDGYMVNYGLSHGGSVDESTTWFNTLRRIYKDKLLARCPEDESPYWEQTHPDTGQLRRVSYGVNDYVTGRVPDYEHFARIGHVKRSATTIIFVEMMEGTENVLDTSYATSDHVHAADWAFNPLEEARTQVALDRHLGRANYAFVDGHAQAHLFEETYQVTGSRRDLKWLHNMYDPKRAH